MLTPNLKKVQTYGQDAFGRFFRDQSTCLE
jgi:hypothetical protein